MPDISKCEAIDKNGLPCPIRDSCYRYTCKPNPPSQSYDNFTRCLNLDRDDCEEYIENRKI
jgi:hypothetical protein